MKGTTRRDVVCFIHVNCETLVTQLVRETRGPFGAQRRVTVVN